MRSFNYCWNANLHRSIGVCRDSFVVDISQELDLITTGQQSEGGNGLLPCLDTRVWSSPLIGQYSNFLTSHWSMLSLPASCPMIGWWPLVRSSPRASHPPGKRNSSALRLQKYPESCLYFEHKMIQHQWYPVIIWASIIRHQAGAGNNESDCLIVLAI